ncbi:MAG: hypothetical protein ACKO47_05670 [Alphaproteobacteria bacterium]
MFNSYCLKNLIKNFSTISFLLMVFFTLSSCRVMESFGFYQPIGMNMKIPDGPPEFKAGWHDGCQTALGMRYFLNSYVYQGQRTANFGSGVHQHDPIYNSAWSNAFFSCVTYSATFTNFNSMKFGPLE